MVATKGRIFADDDSEAMRESTSDEAREEFSPASLLSSLLNGGCTKTAEIDIAAISAGSALVRQDVYRSPAGIVVDRTWSPLIRSRRPLPRYLDVPATS